MQLEAWSAVQQTTWFDIGINTYSYCFFRNWSNQASNYDPIWLFSDLMRSPNFSENYLSVVSSVVQLIEEEATSQRSLRGTALRGPSIYRSDFADKAESRPAKTDLLEWELRKPYKLYL